MRTSRCGLADANPPCRGPGLRGVGPTWPVLAEGHVGLFWALGPSRGEGSPCGVRDTPEPPFAGMPAVFREGGAFGL